MNNAKINKYTITSAVTVTVVSIFCNLNLMIAPNPINLLNVVLSAVTWILWMVTITSIVNQSKPSQRKAIYIAISS